MEMLRFSEQYGHGDLDARVNFNSGNEFGKLAASFNNLAESNKLEIRSREKANRIAGVMLVEEEVHSFCHELLKALLENTNSQVGALYLLNDEKSHFDLFESIGMGPAGKSSFSATSYEGEFGMALSTRKSQVIRKIPENTPFLFSTTSGDFKPREIITIPILSGKEVVAVISLSSLTEYSLSSIRLVTDIHDTLIARMNGVLAHQKILEFSDKLELQNRELDERAKELAIQGNELTEQNIELEMQKKELDDANRLKSTFLSNMSHELRTPLNSVIALSGVLTRRLEKIIPEEESSYLEIIERNGKNLLTLINDILDLSRIESGHEEISAAPLSVFELVEDLVAMLEPQAREKNLSLLNNISRDLPSISSDYVKCRHILQNLIGNAVKFTDKGRVEISAKRSENKIHILVTDTGIGISEEDQPFIFDEFRQADEGSARRFGGTGLGLSIARKYATLLQGEITIKSEHGKGSTFTLILPVSLDGEGLLRPEGADEWRTGGEEDRRRGGQADRRSSGQVDRMAEGLGKTILLVEDSEPAIIQMKEILAEQGYHIQIARNGKEALDQIALAIPDGMILDLMMPEVDGFQVLKSIR
ncbi:MAG: ATP-binding protein, partial [bacterium]